MNKASESDNGDNKNKAKKQGQSKSPKLRKPAPPIPPLADARDRLRLATDLEMQAGRAAAMLRSLHGELWYLYQSLPRFEFEFDRINEMQKTVDTLADELTYAAGAKRCDALAEMIGAGCTEAFPAPPAGLSPCEALIIERLEYSIPLGDELEELHHYVDRQMGWKAAPEIFNYALSRLERKKLIECKTTKSDGVARWHLAGTAE